jgi:hypothetical protein
LEAHAFQIRRMSRSCLNMAGYERTGPDWASQRPRWDGQQQPCASRGRMFAPSGKRELHTAQQRAPLSLPSSAEAMATETARLPKKTISAMTSCSSHSTAETQHAHWQPSTSLAQTGQPCLRVCWLDSWVRTVAPMAQPAVDR